MAPANFLSLPGELRNTIYAHVFTSPPKQLYHPWDDGRSCDLYLSLFLTCRQVYSEASSLLWQDYAQDISLHFDNGSKFDSFMQHELTRWPQVNSAGFRLRVTVPDQNNLAAEAEQLVPAMQLLSLPNWERFSIANWAMGVWKSRLYHTKYRDIGCADCGDENGTGTYRATDTLRGLFGLSRAFYTWESWLKTEEEITAIKVADFFSSALLEREIFSLQNGTTLKAVPSILDRARGKVTSECVIIEGSIRALKLLDPSIGQPDTESSECANSKPMKRISWSFRERKSPLCSLNGHVIRNTDHSLADEVTATMQSGCDFARYSGWRR